MVSTFSIATVAAQDGLSGYRPGETVELNVVVKNTGTTAIDGATIDLTNAKAVAGSGYTIEPESDDLKVTLESLEPTNTATIQIQREITEDDFDSDSQNEKNITVSAHFEYEKGQLDVTATSDPIRICRSEYAVDVTIIRTNQSADEAAA